METEMGEFINKEIQEAPWPEDHDTRINQGMQTALNNLNKHKNFKFNFYFIFYNFFTKIIL